MDVNQAVVNNIINVMDVQSVGVVIDTVGVTIV